MTRTFWVFFSIIFIIVSCKTDQKPVFQSQNTPFVSVQDGQFYLDGTPYYFVGANYWYGPLLGSPKAGNRKRLIQELDLLASYGINNLRVLAGAEGGHNPFTVSPALQYEKGKYNEDLLSGLDYFMKEAGERNIKVVLYLNNNWEWSGGMSQYLSWNGYGEIPIPNLPQYSWPQYMEYTRQFHSCEACKKDYWDHLKFMMNRTNQYTGVKYKDDPTLMSWQVANEPRVFDEEHEPQFTAWLHQTLDLMNSLDTLHLISTGGEGSAGYLFDLKLFERTHDHMHIDYLTMHMWPHNWSWFNEDEKEKQLGNAKMKAKQYIKDHQALAKDKRLPIVMSEFGFPRDGRMLHPGSTTTQRDEFYLTLFDLLEESYNSQGTLAGYNFWGFGGFGLSADRPDGKWEPGDDLMADPPQEPQGFNNVYASDTSTLKLIKHYNEIVNARAFHQRDE